MKPTHRTRRREVTLLGVRSLRRSGAATIIATAWVNPTTRGALLDSGHRGVGGLASTISARRAQGEATMKSKGDPESASR
jgi:hypothetical protein